MDDVFAYFTALNDILDKITAWLEMKHKHCSQVVFSLVLWYLPQFYFAFFTHRVSNFISRLICGKNCCLLWKWQMRDIREDFLFRCIKILNIEIHILIGFI